MIVEMMHVYCLDLAPGMVKRAVQNFKEYDDFNANERNNWEYVRKA
jgi:hypothetical protein